MSLVLCCACLAPTSQQLAISLVALGAVWPGGLPLSWHLLPWVFGVHVVPLVALQDSDHLVLHSWLPQLTQTSQVTCGFAPGPALASGCFCR